MIKVSEGKYRVGDSSLLIFVRVRARDYPSRRPLGRLGTGHDLQTLGSHRC